MVEGAVICGDAIAALTISGDVFEVVPTITREVYVDFENRTINVPKQDSAGGLRSRSWEASRINPGGCPPLGL